MSPPPRHGAPPRPRFPPPPPTPPAALRWALLRAVARRVVEADRAVRAGLFPGGQSMYFVGGEVHGKILGIIGLGRIGEAVARRARGFGLRMLYCPRHRLDAAREAALGATYRALDDLLREADFVSGSVGLTPGTGHPLA